MDEFLDVLKTCVLTVELELKENEQELIETEKTISRLESYCEFSSIEGVSQCRTVPLTRHNYEDLLKLLMSAERSARQCNNLKEELETYNTESAERLAPGQVITKIIDYHTKALEMLEQQINQLEVQVNEVQSSFEEICTDLDISSLCTKCTCQMAAELRDGCDY